MDTGLYTLAALANFHKVPADVSQLRHEFSPNGELFDTETILRAAKSLTLKAKEKIVQLNEITNSILPAIARSSDGRFFIIAQVSQSMVKKTDLKRDDYLGFDRVLVHDLEEKSPKKITPEELSGMWSGRLILVVHRHLLIDGMKKTFDISWFIPSIIKYKKIFLEVLVASFCLQIFSLVTPLFFQVVMDKVLVHRGFSTLNVLAVGFFFIIIFESFLGGFRNYLFSHTTNRMDVELGSRLFNHLLSLPLSYFESRQVGQNVARVKELDSVRNFITGTALTLIIDILFLFVFIAVMWYYSPILTWVVLGSIPFYCVLSVIITPLLRHRLNEKFKYSAANTSFLTESISGIETVKSLSLEPQMRSRLEDHLSSYVGASFKSQNLSNISNQIAGFINKLVTLVIIWVGAHLVVAGNITVGQLIAFNMLAGRVSSPILKLVNLWQEFQQAGISIQRLGDILNTPKEAGFNPNRSKLPKVQGAIQLESINFRYSLDAPLVLKDISFSINPGEIIGIVGRSGSGKSTFTKLIQRLYVPESGRISVDGVDLSMVDTSWLRRQIGVVLQNNFLFNRSIRENISLVDPSISMEKIIMAAKMSGAHDFIMDFPEGYDTIVEEQGSNLSGGQRQRLAIARALVNDPKILIFDEATSALDYESERLIQENMKKICFGRTVLIIAHRLTTVRDCNRIIVMDKGNIVEQGAHDHLMIINGYYANLYGHQNKKPVLKSVPENKINKVINASDKKVPSYRFEKR